MSEWKEYRLGEIAFVKGGKRLPKGSNLTQTPNSHPYIRVRDMGNRYLPIKDLEYVPNDIFPTIKNYIVNKGDVILSIVGSVGLVSMVNEELDKANLTENCVKILPKDSLLDNYFLYYFLKSNIGQDEIYKKIVGAVQPKLPIYNINDILISLPPLPTQTTIAEILSSLDDKIELNNQINKDLEALAQALFKQWFIDFEFPNENEKPYRSSGGEMVDSELGEIPKGWKVDLLNTVFDFLEGPGLRNWQYTKEGMPFINIRLIQNGDINIEKSSFISKQEFETKYKHFELDEFDFIVSTSGTLGKSAIVRKSHLPLMLNTSVIRFKSLKPDSKCYMYQYLQSESFLEELTTQASGSVQLNFGPMHLNRINMIIPNDSIIKNYEEIVKNVYEKIISNREENDYLSNLRDTLIPKLISGELEVSDIQTKTL